MFKRFQFSIREMILLTALVAVTAAYGRSMWRKHHGGCPSPFLQALDVNNVLAEIWKEQNITTPVPRSGTGGHFAGPNFAECDQTYTYDALPLPSEKVCYLMREKLRLQLEAGGFELVASSHSGDLEAQSLTRFGFNYDADQVAGVVDVEFHPSSNGTAAQIRLRVFELAR